MVTIVPLWPAMHERASPRPAPYQIYSQLFGRVPRVCSEYGGSADPLPSYKCQNLLGFKQNISHKLISQFCKHVLHTWPPGHNPATWPGLRIWNPTLNLYLGTKYNFLRLYLHFTFYFSPSQRHGQWYVALSHVSHTRVANMSAVGPGTSNERSHLISWCVWCLDTNMCPTLAVVSALTPGPPLTMVALHTPCSQATLALYTFN